MGFTNTKYNDAVNAFVDTNKQIIKNPLYLFTDKKPTITDYMNRDENVSTLDEASGLEYASLGSDCPAKFNLIQDALLYGIEKIQMSLESDETGVSAAEIAGEAYVLPNTFVPFPGDFFIIKYLKEKVLFKVTEVQPDTLDNGANFYKISYKLDKAGQTYIDDLMKYNIHQTFKMLSGTVGTNFKTIIRTDEYDLISKIENDTLTLKEYYKQLFFNQHTQTFTYTYNGCHFYDPFVVEFIKRNDLLAGTDKYTFVDHAMSTWQTFGIDYDRTIFRAIELNDINKANNCNVIAIGRGIEDPMSLLTNCIDQYFCIDYRVAKPYYQIDIVPDKLIDHIVSGENLSDGPEFYNMIIDSFKPDWVFDDKYLSLLDNITAYDNKVLFYSIPMLIFILERKVRNIMSNKVSFS